MLKQINHILVIDDDIRICDLLQKFLQNNGYFVSWAHNTKEAAQQLKMFNFDLLIVDVMMPEESGLEFTKKFRKTNDTPILMLTAMGETQDRITGLEMGADDYMPKPFEPRELILRVEKIIKRTGEKIPKSSKINFGNKIFDLEKKSLKENEEIIFITSNEETLLSVLAENPGKIYSRENLAKICGGINERSIDVQITRLRNKIEQNPKKPAYLKTVRGKGYLLQGSYENS